MANFIQGAIKNPGYLRGEARKAGAITPQGTIRKSWIASKSSGGGHLARAARLAEILASLHRKK